MQLQELKIAIIGAGPGGLTLARLLQMEGAQVQVFERDKNRNARVQGSPLDLHDISGLAALSQAGLLDAFKANYMRGADKKIIADHLAVIHYSDHHEKLEENFGDPGFRPEIDRGVLRQILLDSLDDDTVQWDSHFINMENAAEGWLLSFKDGSKYYADLVIGADGARSKIRPYLTTIKPFYTGIIMLEGLIDQKQPEAKRISEYLKGGKVMAFGKQQNLLMGQKANQEIGFYASFKAPEDWVETIGLDFNDTAQVCHWFKQNYSTWDTLWEELFHASSAAFVPRPIYCMPLDQDWESQSNLTILGDAAHLMPPFAGEGVNMAMLDALELYQQLIRVKNDDYKTALEEYEIQMRKRAALAAKESLENGERMHADQALATMLTFFQELSQ